jgi:putative NADH-flavin reductase
MRVLVVGAAGRTGREIVRQALGHGHDVRALVRSTALEVDADPRLEIVKGDVLDFDTVNAAMADVDAVAFAVGSGGGGKVTVYSEGIANVLHAMAANDVIQLAAVSAAGVFARKDKNMALSFRALIATVLKPVYDDMERMEQRIAASGVSWTIVRPVGLTDDPQTGDYRISLDGSLLKKATRIPRADVAALTLKALETGAYDRKTLVIAT